MPAGKLIHAVLDNYATHKHPKSLPSRRRGCSLGCAPSALGLSFYSDFGLLAERGRKRLLQDDAATYPPWCVPLDRRPAERHQCLPRRAQCQSQTLRLNQIRRGHPGQARPSPCDISLSQCTSIADITVWSRVVRIFFSAAPSPSRCPQKRSLGAEPASGVQLPSCKRAPDRSVNHRVINRTRRKRG